MLRFWQLILQILVTPITVHLLGPSAYGLVGFFATLSLFFTIVEQAPCTVLTRQLGLLADQPENAASLRSLLRTMEIMSVALGIGVGGLLMLAAPLIARDWLVHSDFPDAELIAAIRLMGLCLMCRAPASLYSAGFIGLHRQPLLLPVSGAFATVLAVGTVILLIFVSASPEVYFTWLAIASFGMSLVLRWMLWRVMPASDEPSRIDFALLRPVWRFTAGNVGISLTSVLLTQWSSLVIARYCTLDQLAAYTLALNFASQVATLLSQPISATLMPHFAGLIAKNNEAQLAREYHRWSQNMALVVLPVVGTLMVFARPLLQIWLGPSSPMIAPVEQLLPWIALGTLFNTLMMAPYFLQTSHGWTRLSVGTNVIALIFVLPALAIGVPIYGPPAAVACWIALNVGYFLIMVPMMHRRLLRNEMWNWWLKDSLLPMALAAVLYAGAAILLPGNLPLLVSLAVAAVVAGLATLALLSVLPLARNDAIVVLQQLRLRFLRAP